MKSLTINRNHVLFAALLVTLGLSKSWSLTADSAYGMNNLSSEGVFTPEKVRVRYKNKDYDVEVKTEQRRFGGESVLVADENGNVRTATAESRSATYATFTCVGEGDSRVCIPARRLVGSDLNDLQKVLQEYVQGELNAKEREERLAREQKRQREDCQRDANGDLITNRTDRLQCLADLANSTEDKKVRDNAVARLEDALEEDITSEDEGVREAAMKFLESISSKTYSYQRVQARNQYGMPMYDQFGMPVIQLKRKSRSKSGFFADSELQTRFDKHMIGAVDHQEILRNAQCIGSGLSHGQVNVVSSRTESAPICRSSIQYLQGAYANNRTFHFGSERSNYELNKDVMSSWRDNNLRVANEALASTQALVDRYFGGDGIVTPLPSQGTDGIIGGVGPRGQRRSISQIPGLGNISSPQDLYQDYGYDNWSQNRNPNLGRNNFNRNNNTRYNNGANRYMNDPRYQRGGTRQPYTPPYVTGSNRYNNNYNNNNNNNYRTRPPYL